MDNQQSDYIEARIRQAAESLSPPVNEEAWRKMEVLLDKEFNKDRRRGLIWLSSLLLLLLLGGAGIYYYENKVGTDNKGVTESAKVIIQPDTKKIKPGKAVQQNIKNNYRNDLAVQGTELKKLREEKDETLFNRKQEDLRNQAGHPKAKKKNNFSLSKRG